VRRFWHSVGSRRIWHAWHRPHAIDDPHITYLIVGQYTDGGNTWFNPHQIVYRQLDIGGGGDGPCDTGRTW